MESRMTVMMMITMMLMLASSAIAATLPGIRVDTGTQLFIDSTGRTRIFHGVNAVFKVAPWLPATDGFDTTTTLSALDARNLSEVFGFTAVRLGFMWPGAAPLPPPAPFNTYYTAKVEGTVDTLGSYGIYTILDAHQDIYNRRWCGEGVPDWATCGLPFYTQEFGHPATEALPTNASDHGYPPLARCLEHMFARYYFSDAVGKSFQALYDNVVCDGQKLGLQDAFAQFWAMGAQTFAKNTNVLGYELINEPWAGDVIGHPSLLLPGVADRQNLAPMYKKLHDTIRTWDDDHIVFFEHSLANILGSSGFTEGPGGKAYNDRQALSYHVYCNPANSSGDPRNLADCDAQDEFPWLMTLEDIERFGCGGFMTEFGAFGDAKITEDNLDFVLGLADSKLQSWTYWQYKYYNDLTTAGSSESFYSPDGQLQTGKVKHLVRTYAQAIQGVPSSMNFDPLSKVFQLKFQANAAIKAPTVIFASEDFWYTSGFEVTVSPSSSNQVTRPKRNFVEIMSTASGSVTVTLTPK